MKENKQGKPQETRVQELLKPRYKVVALWPSTDFVLGQIITNLGESAIRYYDEWPHLFKKLEWWRGRKIEEMPEYLKLRGQNWVFKPIKYLLPFEVICPDEETKTFTHQLQNFIPATETEYLSYLKTKSK